MATNPSPRRKKRHHRSAPCVKCTHLTPLNVCTSTPATHTAHTKE